MLHMCIHTADASCIFASCVNQGIAQPGLAVPEPPCKKWSTSRRESVFENLKRRLTATNPCE